MPNQCLAITLKNGVRCTNKPGAKFADTGYCGKHQADHFKVKEATKPAMSKPAAPKPAMPKAKTAVSKVEDYSDDDSDAACSHTDDGINLSVVDRPKLKVLQVIGLEDLDDEKSLICNATGSADDKERLNTQYTSFIKLWESATGKARDECAILGCSNACRMLHGGHVKARNPIYKRAMFIVPLCARHNLSYKWSDGLNKEEQLHNAVVLKKDLFTDEIKYWMKLKPETKLVRITY